MWWCCGRTRFEARGCKFSKHESKEDEEAEELAKAIRGPEAEAKMVCVCCRESGHL